jgi:hypothetical protein
LLASQPGLSRRAALRLLGVSALATIAGCRPSKKSDDGGTSSGGAPPAGGKPSAASASAGTIAPAQALAKLVADDERALIAAYDAAIEATPELESVLAPLRADHAAHLVGLTPGAPTTQGGSVAGTSATPTPTPSAVAGSAAASPPNSPAQSLRAQTLTALAAKERAAAAARVDDLMSAEGSLARLLASIGGCEASHASLLAGAS